MTGKKTLDYLCVITVTLAAVFVLPAGSSPAPEGLSQGNSTTSSSYDLIGEVRNPEITVDQDEARHLYPYGLASTLAYSYKLERSDPQKTRWNFARLEHQKLKPVTISDIPVNASKLFKLKTGRFEDKSSGLQARGFIHTPTDTLILAFAGTDFEATYRSLVTASASVQIAWGYEPEILHEAASLCKNLKEGGRYKRIVLTGSSLGGAVAQYASLACGSQAIVFNTLALPENLRHNAAYSRSQIDQIPVDEVIKAHEKTLILSEVEKEVLNNEETWGHYIMQNDLPKDMSVFVIPSANRTSSTTSRHWAPAVIEAIEKRAGYDFNVTAHISLADEEQTPQEPSVSGRDDSENADLPVKDEQLHFNDVQ